MNLGKLDNPKESNKQWRKFEKMEQNPKQV